MRSSRRTRKTPAPERRAAAVAPARARPAHAVDVASTVRRLPVSPVRVRETARRVLQAEGVRDAMISITFLGRAAMSAINRRYLGHSGATDVISFGLGQLGTKGAVIGDIYICPDVARANARAQAVPVREELLRLVVHGMLHVLGHGHPEGSGRTRSAMWMRQERILRRVL